MLILRRFEGESIVIGGNIIVTVVDIRGDKVRLGITAPSEVSVHRQEIQEAIDRQHAARFGDVTLYDNEVE